MVSIFVLISVIEKVAAWSSIAGLCISIATMIIAGSVKRAIHEANKKVLLKGKLDDDLGCLRDLNSTYVEMIRSSKKDKIAILNALSRISSQVCNINRYVPKEFVRKGKSLIKSISLLCRSQIDIGPLWGIYRDSVRFVDELSNYSREKEIIS